MIGQKPGVWRLQTALTLLVVLLAAPRPCTSGLGSSLTGSAAAAFKRLLGEESSAGTKALPSSCPAGCTQHGTCNEELGRCDCPWHLKGPDCSTPEPDTVGACARYGHTSLSCQKEEPTQCLNACNSRGKCIGGWCHCKPGYYGADCSLSLDPATRQPVLLAGQGYVPRASGPRIYVYELPPQFNMWHNIDRMDRPLYALFWQRLLTAGVRVARPEEADFFFVPVKLRLSYDSDTLLGAIQYIKQTWPYWNATHGHRHILIHTGDWGRDDLKEEVAFMTRNATWLTHWGLAADHDVAKWKASHRPSKDIVIPPMLQASLLNSLHIERSPLHPGVASRRNRTRALFFAGRVCGNKKEPIPSAWPNCFPVIGTVDMYSASTRQRTFYHHANRTNFKLVTKTRTYSRDLLTSMFCLAPTGSGSGKRAVVVMLMGCIPLTVTDGLLQAFEPEIHWDRFALDVRERDIPIMDKILEALTPGQIAEYQSRLRCAAQHLLWSSFFGAVLGEDGRYDAFETVLQILRMRKKYPDMAAEEYAANDAAFRRFMDCELDVNTAPLKRASANSNGGNPRAVGVMRGHQLARPRGAGGDEAEGVAQDDTGAAVDQDEEGGSDNGGDDDDGDDDAGQGVGEGLLCSANTAASVASSCSMCMRRRGKMINPGGAICCNKRQLAKCPRLWD